MSFLRTPDEKQLKAINHDSGPALVLAGPGSGKTFTIVSHIQYLIRNKKIPPEEILVVTFSKAAAIEMQTRYLESADSNPSTNPVRFGTFHSLGYQILRSTGQFRNFSLITDKQKYHFLEVILKNEGLSSLCTHDQEAILLNALAARKAGGIEKTSLELLDVETPGFDAEKLFALYQSDLEERRLLDYDDLILKCNELFRKSPAVLERYQQLFTHILVDEFQDVNKIQYEILKMLALPENNLFVVGDDDQSIYQFRGADPSIMLGFSRDYPDAGQILLDVNYRSTAHILNGALRVIGHNEQRFSKEIKPHAGKGECVHVQEVLDVTEEGKYVIEGVKKRMEQGVPAREIAVLFRTNRDARILAEMLAEYQIPFEMKENIQNIYDHFIARNIKSYLKLAAGSRERRYFLDIMNCPKRYLSRECLESSRGDFEEMRKFYCDKGWMQDRIDQFEWDVKMMENKTPYAAIQYIRKKIGYDDYLKEYAKIRRIREEDLFEILYEIQERSKEFQSFEEWFLYIENYGQMLKEKKGRGRKDQTGEQGVSLMTMHGAKGLEFDTVFVIGGNEGVTPYRKAKLDEEIEEERRMFYVAMTRAKRKLVISYVKTKNGKELSPSRFVEELLLKEGESRH